ncbi:TonB-dependent receptor domain-containing protein [Asticcacaulis sp. YBE204]|uniref:TonB-dependent receptor domain-containing protein n=1 Tax=Asticcacaulis sp. YBE204 TaxID=1282363 RepID=UPI0003C3B578|nr:TonB-dependent receptor [Asticcacaulis sp. YBE204]ESQ78299.1 hypothetical protein AEYBE204_14100 [Asticcacaulis sp. YBE204]
MQSHKTPGIRRALTAGTALAMIVFISGQGTAFAQDAAPAANDDATTVIVTGVRASQRTAIDRKKKAKTATDSIIAEDVGKFPDKNIGEAISRIAGVALSRSDYGEGETVSVRGGTSAQTSIEIDGLGVQNTSTTGGLAFNGDGRSKDFREFPADLIKSVDVIKGNTAAQTEGGIGGGIVIQTRSPLDFKKPFVSFRYDMTQNSLSKKWTPEVNLIATSKFFDGRLGILFNASQSSIQNDNNAVQNSTSGTQGLSRAFVGAGTGNVIGTTSIDLDNSAEKTFTFNPSTLSGAGINTVFANSTETPLSLVTKSAAAKTKAECMAAFPMLTGNSAATAQRTNELITCLNQWGDYTPSLVRYFVRQNKELRQTVDLRADYRVNEHLDVYAKVMYNKRVVEDVQLTLTPGQILFNSATTAFPANGSFAAYNGATYTDTGNVRSAIAGSGYYLYDGISFGSVTAPNNAAATANGVIGAVSNLIPSSLKFDANHHLIAGTITDGSTTLDQVQNTNDISSKYFSAGADFHRGPIKATLLYGHAESEYTRYDYRINPGLSYAYGQANLTLENGLWNFSLPANFDTGNASNYTITRAAAANRAACTPTGTNPCVTGQTGLYTVAQQPWTSFNIGIQMSPKLSETSEDTLKGDFTYNFEDKIPFIKTFQLGFNNRKTESYGWDGSGRTISPENTHIVNGVATTPYGTAGYVAPVVIARQNLRGVVRACDDTRYGTTGTAAPAGALPCNYGYLANTDLSTRYEGTYTMRPADLQTILSQVLVGPTNQFFAGFPDRGNLINGFSQIDVHKFYNLIAQSATGAYGAGGNPLEHYNFDCMKVCTASDGKQYDMLYRHALEETTAAYWMVEFEQELPFDMLFNGNVGTRMVKTDVEGTGFITLSSVRCSSTANCNASTATSGTYTLTAQTNVAVSSHTTDWLPSYNFNLWVLPDQLVVRYNTSKSMSRPSIAQLLPAGTCTFDQRFDGAGADNGCGTFGNPGLKPLKAKKKNLSIEWYPNKDTQFSYAHFEDDITGSVTTGTVADAKLLTGTGAVDPVTGRDVSNDDFAYTTYVNAGGFLREGDEYSFKSAFTFLPWKLRYLGADGNYAKITSTTNSAAVRDPNSGTVLPPIGEPSYYANASLWYDDGQTNARISYQARSEVFNCIAACGANTAANYLGDGYTNVRLPYNPGAPTYTDESKYVDIKVSHKFRPEVEVFFQMTNALKQETRKDQGSFVTYADGTPSVLEVGYGGYRVTAGFTLRTR